MIDEPIKISPQALMIALKYDEITSSKGNVKLFSVSFVEEPDGKIKMLTTYTPYSKKDIEERSADVQ